MLKILILTMSLLFVLPGYAYACTYNGQSYEEGAIIGPYVCSEGKWVSR